MATVLRPKRGLWETLWVLGLLLILLAGWGLRTIGLDWDEHYGLHPDERFLAMVLSSIQPTFSPKEYFDPTTSPLNPANRGFGFYVYGTFPLFLIRYTAHALGKTGYGDMMLLARAFSALMDIGTLLLVAWMARRLYGLRAGLLAAGLYAFSVMPIQQSHFGTVDNFVVFFTTACLALAVALATRSALDRRSWPLFLGFGLAFGAAMASKVSALPAAGLLPLAVAVHTLRYPQEARRAQNMALAGMVAAAAVSLLVFRVLQPYAFTGPHFWDFRIHPEWLANLKALQAQASGKVDFPPSIQWARRPLWYGWVNYTQWGVGPALATLVWLGVVLMAWRMARRRETVHLPVWLWGVGYFAWQSTVWNPTMRYFLPAYPALTVVAVWAVEAGLHHARRAMRLFTRVAALAVVVLTAAWALAFVHIYTRPHTRLAATRWIFRHLPGPVNLVLETPNGPYQEPLPVPPSHEWRPDQSLVLSFRPRMSGTLSKVVLYRVEHLETQPEPGRVTVLLKHLSSAQTLAQAEAPLPPPSDPVHPPKGAEIVFPRPVTLTQGETYVLELRVDRGHYRLLGTAIANETSWDDGLPLRLDGYDPFGGLYQGFTLELYYDDTEEKRQRILDILDRADVVLITSSRQWGSLPRLPERFPLVIGYYYALTGCPPEEPLEPCFNRLEPGMYRSPLGFELVKVFASAPTLGPLVINDQPADEAFTVYDHPKVFIFRKTEGYDPERARRILAAVDLRYVQHVLPGEAPSHPTHLLLPPHLWVKAQKHGTWREIFPPASWLNRSQVVALVVWYGLIAVLGWAAWPYAWLVFRRLHHRGYPWMRPAGMLLWAWTAWMVASLGLDLTRGVLWGVFAIYLAGGLALFLHFRREMLPWIREHRRDLLEWEAWFLACFVLDLFLRWMNPDLWHPARGGERPMELSYLHAVLKSVRFPPYDPWFAGGYQNYYYWGFVLVGLPMKLLGLRTEVAFNLTLPTLFAATALAAMGLARSLYRWAPSWWHPNRERLVGLLAVGLDVVVGNLGTVQMFWQGFQRLAGGPEALHRPFFTRLAYAAKGFVLWLAGQPLPYGLGEWYWNPSRIIPAPGDVPPITEFPFFSFLYGDLHPHLIAFAMTLLALAWAWSVVHDRERPVSPTESAAHLLWGGLIIGSLRAINTWDFPTYMLLAAAALGYAWGGRVTLSRSRRGLAALGSLLGLYLAAHMLWAPYNAWYAQGYKDLLFWHGPRTPLSAYLWHWGIFLFLLAPALVAGLVTWAKQTPAAGVVLWWRRYGIGVLTAEAGVFLVLVALGMAKVPVAWAVLPLVLLLVLVVLLPGWPDAARFAAFIAGTALALTLMVEVAVIRGDIGRMNMVFKFYLQAWHLLAVATAVWLGWTLFRGSLTVGARSIWTLLLVALLAGGLLYTFTASIAKIRDRWVPNAPRGLDGLAFLPYATYFDQGQLIPLAEDYRAILWMRGHVDGSPVIVEANTPEYRLGNRYTWFTGLPGVVGWNWHQRQQRGVVTPAEWVIQRVGEVAQFYRTQDRAWVEDFLRRYQVRYIVVGRVERAYYAGPGLDKFPAWSGDLWDPVYRDGETTIYRVRDTVLTLPAGP